MITIVDSGHVLSSQQVEALTAKAAAYPFDLHVLIGTGSGTRAGFEREVASFVKPGSRTVSIGVDPTHHFTFVQSSSSLNVPPGPQVAQAGNAFFRTGSLVDGIDAIAARANELRVDAKVIQSQTGTPIVIHEHHTATGVWWGVGAFLLVATAVVAYVVWRARKARLAAQAAEQTLTVEAAELAARNVEESTWHDRMAATRRAQQGPTVNPFASAPIPPTPGLSWAPSPRYAAPAPVQPIVIQQAQSASALDMLIGYELGRDSAHPAPAVVDRETVVIERESSSSTWDSGSSSSSSSDWGSSSDSSSSSDWGGGSDFGGGGGGSDW